MRKMFSITFIYTSGEATEALFQLINTQYATGRRNGECDSHFHFAQVHNFVNANEINYLLHKIALLITTYMCNMHPGH